MSNLDYLRMEDLVDNPVPRVPVCLCLDTSASMNRVVEGGEETGESYYRDGRQWTVVTGGRTVMDDLNEGIRLFHKSVCEDEMAVEAADVCIVTFNDEAECIYDFVKIEEDSGFPEIKAVGDNTCLGEGVNLALDLIDKRKKEYQEAGVDYYQPWLILMTDGEANGDHGELETAIQRTSLLVNENRLTVIPIGIGEDCDMDVLNMLSPKQMAHRLKDTNFEDCFAWLSSSVSRTSQSMPGEFIPFDEDGIKGWAEDLDG